MNTREKIKVTSQGNDVYHEFTAMNNKQGEIGINDSGLFLRFDGNDVLVSDGTTITITGLDTSVDATAGGYTRYSTTASVVYTNTTETNIITLPAGTTILSLTIYTDTIFDGTGTDLLDIGLLSGTGNELASAVDLSATGWDSAFGVDGGGGPYTMATDDTITFTYTDQNSDAAAGSATIFLEYLLT